MRLFSSENSSRRILKPQNHRKDNFSLNMNTIFLKIRCVKNAIEFHPMAAAGLEEEDVGWSQREAHFQQIWVAAKKKGKQKSWKKFIEQLAFC